MEKIVKKLIDSGKTVKEISKQLGMKPEEIFRLSGMDKKEFLKLMVKEEKYGRAFVMGII